MNNYHSKLMNKLKKATFFFRRREKRYTSYNNRVKNYYKRTKWLLFRLFASNIGFMHIGLSNSGKYRKNSGYEFAQLLYVNKFIINHPVKNVLELGCGQGTNLAFLAWKNPNINLFGIDLYSTKRFYKRNVKIIVGDYHDLSMFQDNSVDLIYAIETLCYATNINKVFQEAYRILVKNGKIIIFDAYRQKKQFDYSRDEILYIKTIEEGFALNQFININYFNQAIYKNKLYCLKEIDLKRHTVGYLKNITTRVTRFFRLGLILKNILYLLPDDVIRGMKSGYLLEDSVKYNLLTYKLHILTK